MVLCCLPSRYGTLLSVLAGRLTKPGIPPRSLNSSAAALKRSTDVCHKWRGSMRPTITPIFKLSAKLSVWNKIEKETTRP
jgi:hypothetical protein